MESTRKLLLAALCAVGLGLAACDEAGEESDQQGAQPPAGEGQQSPTAAPTGEPSQPTE